MTTDTNITEPPKKKAWIEGLTQEMIEKQLALYQTRVKHPAMQKLLDDLMPLLMPHSESNIIIVTGATGVGKSTLTRVVLKSLMDEFAQLVLSDAAVIPMISVEAYANGDVRHGFKGLFQSLIQELAEPGAEQKAPVTIKEGRMVVAPQAKYTVEGLRTVLEKALTLRRTRVGVIDEAAHLMRFGKDAAVMDTLKSIANTSGCKWLLVGSFDLFDLVVENGQVARRTSILNLERYQLDAPEDRLMFRDVVKKLQARWPADDVPNFVAISDALLEVSLGCVGLLKSLLLDASAMQLRNGGVWRPEFLKKAAKANKLRDVIRKEIEIGEAKVRDALHGESLWDDDTFSKLVHKMETA